MENFTWPQLSILLTIILGIISSTGYLTRIIDRKMNTIDYETKHALLKEKVDKLELKNVLLEERYKVMKEALKKNGYKDLD